MEEDLDEGLAWGDNWENQSKKDGQTPVKTAKSPATEVRGYHELTFLEKTDQAASAEVEVDDGDVGPEFDAYEDLGGDKLRLLDSFAIYYEDGRPAPPQVLDSAKEKGLHFVAFGSLVAPITDDARIKLMALDARVKGRIPPCLLKRLDGSSPDLLPGAAASSSAASSNKKLSAAAGRGKAKKSKSNPKSTAKPAAAAGQPPNDHEEVAETTRPWGEEGEGPGEKMARDSGSPDASGPGPSKKRARKSNVPWSPEEPESNRILTIHPPQPPQAEDDTGAPLQGGGDSGAGGGGAGNGDVVGKKRKPVSKSGGGAKPAKKPKPLGGFSYAEYVGGVDGSEARGVPGGQYVGECFRKERSDGVLLYYVDKSPKDFPFEYESKAAGAAGLDWDHMGKDVKVDAFCMETFRWYGAKVAEVSPDHRQIKVHFNGWKAKFDEWMDWGSFRLAPCGSRSTARREGGEVSMSKAAHKDNARRENSSSSRCVLVPARPTVRVRISEVEDWCMDTSDPSRPVMWLISSNAWYKLAGGAWWDHVAPHPTYAGFFEPGRHVFATCAMAVRSLLASPMQGLQAVSRRMSQLSSGMFDLEHLVTNFEIVLATVSMLGTLTLKKKAGGTDSPYGGIWLSAGVSEKDGQNEVTSVEAKDSPFAQELLVKGQEWVAQGRPKWSPAPSSHSVKGSHPNANPRGSGGQGALSSSLSTSPGNLDLESSVSSHDRQAAENALVKAIQSMTVGNSSSLSSSPTSPNPTALSSKGVGVHGRVLGFGSGPEDTKELERVERERKKQQLKDEKERQRHLREAERAAKAEVRRLEKEAKDREKAEAQAREQARREIEKEKARQAKRFPLPDEELWAEMAELGKSQRTWPESEQSIRTMCPRGFPPQQFGPTLGVWAGLQLFGSLMSLERFTLEDLLEALTLTDAFPQDIRKQEPNQENQANQANQANQVKVTQENLSAPLGDSEHDAKGVQPKGAAGGGERGFSMEADHDHETQGVKAHTYAPKTKAELEGGGGEGEGALSSGGGDGGAEEGADAVESWKLHREKLMGLLMKIHMHLLDYLVWDRAKKGQDSSRSHSSPAEKSKAMEAYWKGLFPPSHDHQTPEATAGGGGGGAGGGHGSCVPSIAVFDEELAGTVETTLAGLEGGAELAQPTPHGWPELLRLLMMRKELDLAMAGDGRGRGTRRGGAAAGWAWAGAGAGAGVGGELLDWEGGDRHAIALARHLDPLGEVARILGHMLQSEESRAFAEPASDKELGREGDGGEGDGEREQGEGAVDSEGVEMREEGQEQGEQKAKPVDVKTEVRDKTGGIRAAGEAEGKGKGKKGKDNLPKRPIDLGTIKKRLESGWYDLQATGEAPEDSGSFGAGHTGVAADVDLMVEGWKEAKGADSSPHPLYDQARALADDFHSLYQQNILKPLQPLEALRARVGVRTSAPGASTPGSKSEEETVKVNGPPTLQEDGVGHPPHPSKSPKSLKLEGEEGLHVADLSAEPPSRGRAVSNAPPAKHTKHDVCVPPLPPSVCLDEQEEVVWAMGVREYLHWPSELKCRCLSWLYDEVMATGTINDLVKKVLDARDTVDRRDRELRMIVRQRLRDQEAAAEAEEEANGQSFSPRGQVHGHGQGHPQWGEEEKEREAADEPTGGGEDGHGGSHGTREGTEGGEKVLNPNNNLGGGHSGPILRQRPPTVPPRTPHPIPLESEADMLASALEVEGTEMKMCRELATVGVRLKPMGVDRDQRRYWLMTSGEELRLLVESGGGGGYGWWWFREVSSIKALHRWLDRRGLRERTLKAAIREHLIDNLGADPKGLQGPSTRRTATGIVLSDHPDNLSDKDEKNLSEKEKEEEEEDHEQWQFVGEPAEVAREKEREKNAGKEALKGCRFNPQEQRSILRRWCSNFHFSSKSMESCGLKWSVQRSGHVMLDYAVRIGPRGLGLGLNVHRGGVIVYEHTRLPKDIVNPGKAAGVQVGDMVVMVHNSVAETPKQLARELVMQGVVKSGSLLLLKVLREVLTTCEDGTPYKGCLTFTPLQMVKGELMDAETRLHHPYVIGLTWGGSVCTTWRRGVSFAGQGIAEGWGQGWKGSGDPQTNPNPDPDPQGAWVGPRLVSRGVVGRAVVGPVGVSDVRMGVMELGRRMLELEAYVAKQDTVVDAKWGEHGIRRKWRTFVSNAQTAHQLLAAWSAFKEMLDWDVAMGCYSDLGLRAYLSLLPPMARNNVPLVGEQVIYYGDGHAMSLQAEAKEGHKAAWGCDHPLKGAVLPCVVKHATYHAGGSRRRSKGSQPFALLELEMLKADTAQIGLELGLGLLPQSDPMGTLNRLLRRAIKKMKEEAQVEPFLEPVSKLNFPDYYEVIQKPMDLTKLWKRCSACWYRTVKSFLDDLSLIATNCTTYCQDKFPDLPPLANAAVKVGAEFLAEPKMVEVLRNAEQEGARLDALWNKHMAAAIGAAPELASMPGMQKLARQLGFSSAAQSGEGGGGSEQGGTESSTQNTADGRVEEENYEDEETGQPNTARIARQVFFDKLVGLKYGMDDPANLASASGLSTAATAVKTSSPAVPVPKPSLPSADGAPCPTPPSTSSAGATPATLVNTPQSQYQGPQQPGVQHAGLPLGEVAPPPNPVLRVAMRLNSEMPEFCVSRTKYDEALAKQWRAEMHIQMPFMEQDGEAPHLYEGTLTGVKPKDPSTGLMPWECLWVEWDDEMSASGVNPWEVEPASASAAAGRMRPPAAGSQYGGGLGPSG